MKTLALMFILILSSIVHASPIADLRDTMLASAKTLDKNFPTGTDVQLTKFAYVCKLEVAGKAMEVVHEKAVLTNMPSPRGQQAIAFFDENGRYLTKIRLDDGEPLWCEGDKLYLFGSYRGPLTGDCGGRCNVMKVGPDGSAKLLHERAYGSSGGTED